MGKNLLKFLFGESQIDEEISGLVEEIAEMDTEGAENSLKVDKKPLDSALKALDIDTEGLEQDPRGLSLVFTDGDAYRAAHALLSQPDSIHKLAQLGWVFSPQGDVAMANEAPQFRIRFLEINEVEPSDEEPKPTKGTAKNSRISTVIKKGREFATQKPEHDGNSPIEYDRKGNSNRRHGLGKEADGGKPEGSPKTGLSKSASGSKPGKGDLTQPEEGSEPSGKLKESQTCRIKGCKGKVQERGLCKTHVESEAERETRTGKHSATINQIWKGHEAGHKAWQDDVAKMGESVQEGKHKPGCQCGFCKNKGNIHLRGKKKDTQEPDQAEETLSPEEIVDRILEGNPGTPPPVTGRTKDRKFRPAQGMVQPDSAIVKQQTKPNGA